jgi:DNA polymerase III subunit beta
VNFRIEKDALFESLQKVFNVVPQKPTLPVLSNFLLRLSSGRLSVSGTDMDISVTTSIECEADGEGSVTVNAKRFLGVVRELPAGEISIDVENEKITVKFKNGSTTMLGLPASDFPILKEDIEGYEIVISGNDFVEMVDKTGFCVSQDRTSRLPLTGVFWRVERDGMMMVATDGHRLSLFGRKFEKSEEDQKTSDFSIEEKPFEPTDTIIPPKTLAQASQIISGGSIIKKVVFGKSAVLFDCGNTVIYSKIIEGPYPNFRQVIPTNNSKKVSVKVEEFEAAVRRVSVISSSTNHQIRISVSPSIMELSTVNEDIGGEARETLAINYEGESMTAGYNSVFLSEILRRVDTDETMLELESPTTACLVKPAGLKETDEYIYLIMPLRLGD